MSSDDSGGDGTSGLQAVAEAIDSLDDDQRRELQLLSETLDAPRSDEEIEEIARNAVEPSSNRRAFLKGAGVLGAAGVAGASAGSATAETAETTTSLSVGQVTSNTYRIAGNRYGGAEAARSELAGELESSDAGARYAADDSGAEYYWTGSGWELLPAKRSAVNTDRSVTAELPVVEVDAFGAEGDGETDDTEAIQRAIDSVNGTGVLAFSAGSEYLVSSTISVDVATIRGIAGRNARVIPDADVDVFDITGSHGGTANPSGTTDGVQDNEMSPFVRNLRVGASDSDPKGTAITSTNTFGLRICGCQLYNLTTGIRFYGNLRNTIITGNHIWHCLDYGVWYDDPDLHQSIIESNHISYCRKAIYVDCVSVECPDINIIGNSLESSSNPATVENIIHMRSSEWIEDVTIVGNLIEDHQDLTGPTILLEGVNSVNNFTRVVIAANGIGNSANADISLSNIKQVSVTGNSITDSDEYAVSIDGQVEALNISNNEVGVRVGTALGFLRVDMDTFCGFWSITGNNATDCSNKPVVVNPDGTNNDRIFSLSFANNNFRDETGESGYAVDFEGLDYLRQTQIMNNSVRCDGATGGGMRVDASEYTLVVIKNNTARGVAGTDFDFPDDTPDDTVVADNLSTS
jgi:hypothetical protein